MDIPILNSERRATVGTKSARQLRSEGRLPGIIYGHGETPQRPISMFTREIVVHLEHGARVLKVTGDGQNANCLIKAVQYDYLNKDPIHIDLTRVNVDEQVTVDVAIELRGTPKAIADGAHLETMKDSLSVSCLAINIPETLHPSIAEMGVGDVLLVKDIELSDGVTALDDPEDKVALVRMPTAEVETEEGEEEESPAEPERIGRVADKEESGDSDSKG